MGFTFIVANTQTRPMAGCVSAVDCGAIIKLFVLKKKKKRVFLVFWHPPLGFNRKS